MALCFKLCSVASSAGGLRYRTGAAFSPVKKSASHFFTPAFGVTGEKEAPNPVTGESDILLMQSDF